MTQAKENKNSFLGGLTLNVALYRYHYPGFPLVGVVGPH
jgi:hypothetical protein